MSILRLQKAATDNESCFSHFVKEIFCAATVQWNWIEEMFYISLKKRISDFKASPSELKSEAFLTTLHWRSTIIQREIHYRRWMDFCSSLYSHTVRFDWKSAHSCAFNMPHLDGKNLSGLSKGIQRHVLAYEYPSGWSFFILFCSTYHIKIQMRIVPVCMWTCTIQ